MSKCQKMKRNFKNLLLFFVLLSVFLGAGNFASAIQLTLPNPLCLSGNNADPNCINTFGKLVDKIINYLVNIVGVLAILMFVWAGALFLTSAGNPTQIEKARKALIFAIIGTAIVLAARGLIAAIQE